jgi:hypothetical protein
MPPLCLPTARTMASPACYHANYYYGGFVKDPDGNNIEAVCHQEE